MPEILRFEEDEKWSQKGSSKSDKVSNEEEVLPEKLNQTEKPSYGYAEAFLFHIGRFPTLTSGAKFRLLDQNSAEFKTLIKFLDNNRSLRKSLKVGVIYAGKGQFDQKQILYNTKGSAKYEELLTKLGKPLNKPELSKVSFSQPKFLYYLTATCEVVFHVVTLMETNFNDDQQLEKKKYVGNDVVHIVWNENDRQYRAGTISGDFNFVHLILHPLRNGLYSLSITNKKHEAEGLVKFFGPLMNGMVLDMALLPDLLRYTAINARKNLAPSSLKICNPMNERKKTLQKIISKFSLPERAIEVPKP